MAPALYEPAMRRALALAAAGLGSTSPNPSVGCVVLDVAGAVVGEGRTAPPGGPHAEVVALQAAGERARGGTAVVTLEPCAHQGRTGPCTTALLDAGVARVVHALPDPSPLAGGGAEVLRRGGVEVLDGVAAAEAERVHETWLHAVRAGRPHVTVKLATSLDGRVAAADGTSKWITGEAARADGRALRGRSDAVVAGIGTVLADDPALTVRDRDGVPAPRQPLRVVVDSRARTPAEAQVLDRSAPTLVVTAGARPPGVVARSADDGELSVLALPGADGRVDLAALLAALHRRGVVAVLVEGGPTLVGAVVDAGLVDRVVAYVAPLLLGGAALPAVGGQGAPTLAAGLRLDLDDVTPLDGDVRLSGRPVRRTVTTAAPSAAHPSPAPHPTAAGGT